MVRFSITMTLIVAFIAALALPARAGVGAPDVSPIFGDDSSIYRAAITTSDGQPHISFYGILSGTTLDELSQITVADLGDKYRDGVDLEGKKLLIHLVITVDVAHTSASSNSPFLTSECEHISVVDGAFRCSLDLAEFTDGGQGVEGLSAEGVRNMFEARDRGSSRFRFALMTAEGDSTWHMSLITLLDASTDGDDDGVPDFYDNCPSTSNFDQIDSDDNGTGDECEEHAGLPEGNGNNPNNNSGNTWVPQDMGFNASGGCSMIPAPSTPVALILLAISLIPPAICRRRLRH